MLEDEKQTSATHIKSTPIEVLNLPLRAHNPLKRNNINTVEQLIDFGEKGVAGIKHVGPTTVDIIFDTLAEFLTLPRDDLKNLKSSSIIIDSNIPELVEDNLTQFTFEDNTTPNLVKLIYPLIKSLFGKIQYDRELDILRRRFGLEGSVIYSLQDIGYFYDLSRERVRQIEKRAIKKVRSVLFGEFRSTSWRVQDELIEEIKSVKEVLLSKYHLATEREIFIELESRYDTSFPHNDVAYLRLLLEIFGFYSLPKTVVAGINRDVNPTWIINEDVNLSQLKPAFGVVHKTLQESVAPTSLFDLKVKINKKRKKKIENEYIFYAIKILKEVEQVADNSFQIKFEYLPSIADKVYRIIYEANKPLHTRDIWREINHRLAKSGLPADANARSIVTQLVTDPRFQPTGRSGIWSLAEWEHVRRETIVELMIEFFHLKQDSATVDEVYESVHSKRQDISKHSVFIYLQTKEKFSRVAKGKYELSAWGGKPYRGKQRLSAEEAERHTVNELDAIFSQIQAKVMPLQQLIDEFRKRTGLSEGSVYRRLGLTPKIKLEPDPNDSRKKLARYVDDYQPKATSSRRKTKREIVQEEIEKYLSQKSGGEALVLEVATHVQKVVSCPRTTFYQYLSEMTSVGKKKVDSDLYCFLVSQTPVAAQSLTFPQIEQIQDDDLRKLLKNAIRLLNIDDVDLGLFQLGRVFENELRAFLNVAKEKGSYDIMKKDLGRLVDMINCIERNKIINKKHHLTLLREQRNERAHGEIPDLKEREKLMQHAPFLGDLYIEYIAHFREKRQDL